MKVWTIANQKGGVGKTTTTVSLGGLLATLGFNTLMVDIDPHGSLTSYFRYDPDAIEASSFSLFKAATEQRSIDPVDLVCETGAEGLYLLPASVALATLDRQAGRLDGMGLILINALNRLSEKYDYVLIDCPPMLGVLMVNALAACERLIIPVQTEFLALKGLERMLNTLKMVLQTRKTELPCIIVPTLFDQRTRASVDSLQTLRSTWPDEIWNDVIPIDTKFREASRVGIPPALFDPHTHGVMAYSRLLEALQQDDQVHPSAGVAG
ncbi:ParA-like protein [hydrothermal vent metagenome]|uniref:ParA-like protein n=1 Tax=hydrothermal vent metagenome TaxID=652676 RepID=A0A3B1BHH4_9ZZZZ